MVLSRSSSIRISAAVALALSVGGCGDTKPANPIDCFPTEGKKWLYLTSGNGQATRIGSEVTRTKQTVYIDRSASMIGYINGANQFSKPFQDLIGDLPQHLSADAVFLSFGRNISEPIQDPKKILDSEYYSCAGQAQSTCESAASHLNMVFEKIARSKDEFAIVVSDLWYDNPEDPMSGVTALQPHLIKILSEGRTIALYGIDAPFDGVIYDLPISSDDRAKIPHKGRHPFYMMVIGPKANVLDFDNKLFALGPKFLEQGMKDGSVNKSLFMVDPGPLTQRVRDPLTPGRHPDIRQVPFELHSGIAVQQFTVSGRSAGANNANGLARLAPKWEGPKETDDPLASDFLPYSVWKGQLKTSLKVYKRLNEKCQPSSWQIWRDVPVQKPKGDKFSFQLDPNRVDFGLRQPGVYAIIGQIERTSVDSENPANRWIREWSVDSRGAAYLASNPPVRFPTLNVADFSRIMEKSLDQAARQKGGGIVGFTVLVKVEN